MGSEVLILRSTFIVVPLIFDEQFSEQYFLSERAVLGIVFLQATQILTCLEFVN